MSYFCTQAEASLGLCTVSKLAGGDTNAALLFQPAKPNSLEAEARRTLRGNILGSPDVALNAVNGMTPRGQQYLFALNRKTALQAFLLIHWLLLMQQTYKQSRMKLGTAIT
ncbi:hypothetical protein [Acinetobacter sp. FDAARGOS_559]|uniref:hypothetical protein n=1 Tax=Acinetobacter sp. FDAARGOS_559 TaxID=2420304 RepID=UPI001D198988|nr:hypothetical protein [Acinetobacter sp. FDAARGOS_559]